jgi:pyruvate-formate lyase-activating enzyme
MLKDFVGAHLEDPKGEASPPERFLDMEELIEVLDGYDFNSVVIEGQEASCDPVLPQITKMLHKRYGSRNTLLTNGYELPDLSHVDQVEIGLKAITNSLHYHYTGVSNNQILKNIESLYKSGKKIFIEAVLIPEYIDTDEIERISRFIANLDKDILFILLPYFKSGDNPWRRPTPTEMEEAADIAKKHLNKVFFFRGDEELKYEVISAFPEGIEEILSGPEVLVEKALSLAGR